MVGRIVFRTLRGDAAEDVAQEVFVRVARYCPFEKLQTGDAFRAYLWKVAQNECYSWLRKRRRHEIAEGTPNDNPEQALDPTSDFEWRELYDLVTKELTSEDRQILLLTDQGFDGDEIAKMVGLSPGNVAVRRHRARESVRKFMQEKGLIP